ncbi:MAG: hypothetical protein H6756_05060 [Candidatus Omnitrophica bacterium]|nr:hypothetical protein [Candidatus Omnitrophota bacterium]
MKYAFLILLTLAAVPPAQAAMITCPDTGNRLTRTDTGRQSGEIYLADNNSLKYHRAICQYGRKNKIVLNWLAPEPVQDLASARSTCSWMLSNAHGQSFRTILGKDGANLYSNTHMVSARLYLSKKEAEPQRRQAWVNHAYGLIKLKMNEALVCEDVLTGDIPQARPTAPAEVDAEIGDILNRLKGEL